MRCSQYEASDVLPAPPAPLITATANRRAGSHSAAAYSKPASSSDRPVSGSSLLTMGKSFVKTVSMLMGRSDVGQGVGLPSGPEQRDHAVPG